MSDGISDEKDKIIITNFGKKRFKITIECVDGSPIDQNSIKIEIPCGHWAVDIPNINPSWLSEIEKGFENV